MNTPVSEPQISQGRDSALTEVDRLKREVESLRAEVNRLSAELSEIKGLLS